MPSSLFGYRKGSRGWWDGVSLEQFVFLDSSSCETENGTTLYRKQGKVNIRKKALARLTLGCLSRLSSFKGIEQRISESKGEKGQRGDRGGRRERGEGRGKTQRVFL